jgi:protein ImuB
MPVAEALAVEWHLRVFPEDPGEDLRALERLAEWATCFSPTVGLEEGPRPQSLLLDITGCAACFGGEDQLLHRAACELKAEGWVGRIAVADTVGAAWGLAHCGRTPCRVPPGKTPEALLPLGVAALRLPLDALHLLAQLGIERVAQVVDLPRDSVPARFGSTILQRLDQALGRLPELIVPHRPPAEVRAQFSFEHPTDRLDAVTHVLEQLTEHLHEVLQTRHLGARQVECLLHHEAAPPTRAEVSLSRPSRSPRHITRLLRTRLEQVRVAEPVSALSLHVAVAESLTDTQSELLETERQPDREGLAVLIDHLSNRLGRAAVTRVRLVPDPQPEYACRFEPLVRAPGDVPATGRRPKKGSFSSPSNGSDGRFPFTRPLRLWPTPEPIVVLSVVPEGPPIRMQWAGTDYRVLRSWGPERIETGWWRDDDVRRDYYVTSTDRGNRFWIFRRRDDGRWFLHGCFD